MTCSPPALEQPVGFLTLCQVAKGGEALQGTREHPRSKYLIFQGMVASNSEEPNQHGEEQSVHFITLTSAVKLAIRKLIKWEPHKQTEGTRLSANIYFGSGGATLPIKVAEV